MKTTDHIREFLDAFVSWASDQSDVQGIALVGSYARGAAREDSDIDVVILTDLPKKYLDDIKWTERFGSVEKHQTEDYGRLISIRVWYQNGVEVEYGITVPTSPKRTLRLVQPGFQNDYFINAILADAYAVAMVRGS